MYHVVVATRNPAKILAVTEACKAVFHDKHIEVEGVDVESGVSPQPLTDSETWQGANHRLSSARKYYPDATLWIAIEAGIDKNQAFAWIIAETKNQRSESRSASFMLPDSLVTALQEGAELGPLMSTLTGIENIKHKGGAIGAITSGLLTRSSVYQQAIILALSPLIHPFYAEAAQ
ncbi:inosine/xanthosine triphosphatase [Rosenbergiella sp. S61]|uniref:Inosine/xanthosine triphosphatase n=1 Tax=Rosenbergiella gaditana TaxID=2726987 RepID=A0ABS5SWC3_9GAMM|nr:inosine/xanthosine triphosphatase [Rosenbergiella gaditana]MBT0724212.1 inosine/xanthosine triphosphatase [Rosenbergiella gaditana]